MRVLGVTGVLLVALFVALGRIPAPHERIALFLPVFFAGFAVYAVAVVVALRTRVDARGPLTFVFAVAVLMRLALVFSPPALSDDIYRYLWEGRVVVSGMNPFEHAPDDAQLEFLRDENYDGINHKDMETIYPPFSQAVFALGAMLHPSLTMQKLLFALFDLMTILVLMAILDFRGGNPMAAVVYAWSPLVAVETAHSGHLDAVGVFMLMLGLYLLLRGRELRGFAAFAGAFLAKYLSAILVPFFLRRRRYWPGLALMGALIVAAYLPFAGAGTRLFSSLLAYGEEWHFNSAVFGAISLAWDDPAAVRRVLLAAVVVFAVVQAFRHADITRYAYLVIAFALLLTPTMYPWYLVWIVPFLCFFPNRAWILFTGLSFLSYQVWWSVQHGGEWLLPGWVYAVEYVPFLGLLAFDAIRGKR